MSDKKASSPSAAIERLSDEKIVDSWRKNAAPWITAVREEQIESRKLATNKAILEAIESISPSTVLDIGCGEGWLAHRLAATGVDVLGTDVVPELIAKASVNGGGRFEVMSYEEIATGRFDETFDVVVCNFALLGYESVDGIFRSVPRLLSENGAFIVQTVHPLVSCGELPYMDGWREGTWAGFSSEFTDPAPWYFRTLESWVELFVRNGLRISRIVEPVNPTTQKPASVLFIGKLR